MKILHKIWNLLGFSYTASPSASNEEDYLATSTNIYELEFRQQKIERLRN